MMGLMWVAQTSPEELYVGSIEQMPELFRKEWERRLTLKKEFRNSHPPPHRK